jgi:AraC family transcriptional regulator of adaptative response / DNA-3-methyladenine glycosylase II
LFDLDAQPDIVRRHLGRDKLVGALIRANPGLRVPGAFNGFEMGLRAILGQQVTVKAATTSAGRLAAALGDPIVTPFAELNRLTPSPSRIAAATIDDLARHGIVGARCRSIVALAQAEASGSLSLDSGHHDPDAFIARLVELPGIGPWTAHYIAMRALRWPDAFPTGDVAILNSLGGVNAKEADALSQAWRPWRSYAVLHLWRRPEPAASRSAAAISKEQYRPVFPKGAKPEKTLADLPREQRLAFFRAMKKRLAVMRPDLGAKLPKEAARKR